VHLDRIDVPGEQALRLAAHDHAREAVDDRPVKGAHGRRLAQVPAARLVLGDHQADESLVLDVVVVGELDDPPHRVDRLQVVEVEFALGVADLRIHLLEHRDVELFLAAEVVVDQRPGGMGAGGDRVHARAFEAARGELVDGRRDDARPVSLGRLGLAHRRRAAGGTVGSGSSWN
jgi:hypothetical protein